MAKSQAELIGVMEETKTDPNMKIMEKVRLPKIPGDEQNYVNVMLNGVVYQVQRGVTVEIPMPVAKILENSERMSESADMYLEKLTQKALP